MASGSPRRISSTGNLNGLVDSLAAVPYTGRGNRRRASLTGASNLPAPDPNMDLSVSSYHGPGSRRDDANSNPAKKSVPSLIVLGNLVDLKRSGTMNTDSGAPGAAASSSSRVREVLSIRRTKSFSGDGHTARDDHRHCVQPDSDQELEKRGSYSRTKSQTSTRNAPVYARKDSRKEKEIQYDYYAHSHSHDDSCTNASSNCAHEKTPSKVGSATPKKDKKKRVSASPAREVPARTTSLRVRRAASVNNLMDDSSQASGNQRTTRRSNSGTRLSSTKKSGNGKVTREVSRTFSTCSGAGMKRSSTSSSKDRALLSPRRSSSNKGLSSSRHGKSRAPATPRGVTSTPRQRSSASSSRNKAAATAAVAAVALLADKPPLEVDDAMNEVAATPAVEPSNPPPPRRHNPAETWICECGHELRLCMKFCGYCAKPQNWVCRECAFGENLQGFSFCGGCAAPKTTETPQQSFCNNRGRNRTFGIPSSPQSVAVDLGE